MGGDADELEQINTYTNEQLTTIVQQSGQLPSRYNVCCCLLCFIMFMFIMLGMLYSWCFMYVT